MEFTQNDPIDRQAELRIQIEHAEGHIRQASQPLSTLRCAWGLTQDAGRLVITLTVRDTVTGLKRTVRYTREDLGDRTTICTRFNSAVGDVLNPR